MHLKHCKKRIGMCPRCKRGGFNTTAALNGHISKCLQWKNHAKGRKKRKPLCGKSELKALCAGPVIESGQLDPTRYVECSTRLRKRQHMAQTDVAIAMPGKKAAASHCHQEQAQAPLARYQDILDGQVEHTRERRPTFKALEEQDCETAPLADPSWSRATTRRSSRES